MKKVVGLFLILFTAAFLPAVSAEPRQSIAIIDTAVDTSKINIAYEVCMLNEKRCPNKQTFMEGPGSATLPATQLYKNNFDHGTIMSMIASTVNPNMDIVFIRIVPMTNAGTQGYYDDNDLNSALNWVLNNKSKFNIVAVSASLGNHSRLKTGANYCPVNQTLTNTIRSLQTVGIPTILAAGNNYDVLRVDYPACISEAVAVSSVGERGNIENYSNAGPSTDFYALGTYNTSIKRAMGTSAATAAFAAYWVKNYKGNYQTTYDYLKSIGKYSEGNGIKTNLFVNVLG